jgi:hypothetical protein
VDAVTRGTELVRGCEYWNALNFSRQPSQGRMDIYDHTSNGKAGHQSRVMTSNVNLATNRVTRRLIFVNYAPYGYPQMAFSQSA